MNRALMALIAILFVILGVLTIRSAIEKRNLTPENATKLKTGANDPSHFEAWKEFTWKEGHFGIMLPTTPHHVRDKTLDPRTKEILLYDTFVSADEEGQGYMINTITFPKSIDDENVATTLENVVTDIIARNPESKLNSIKEGKFKAYKALDFGYVNGGRTIHGKVFAVGNTVYMLGVIDTSSEMDKELEFFMNSFEIIKEPK